MVNLITLIIGILILSSVCQSLWGALSFVNAPYKNVFIIIIIIIIIIIFYYYYYYILLLLLFYFIFFKQLKETFEF